MVMSLFLLLLMLSMASRGASSQASETVLPPPSIGMIFPSNGDVLAIPEGKDTTQLKATFFLSGSPRLEIGEDGVFLHVRADGDQVKSNFFSPMQYVSLVKLEPGTHTVHLQLRRESTDLRLDPEDRVGSASTLIAECEVVFDVVLITVPLFFPPPDRDKFINSLPQVTGPYMDMDGYPRPIRIGVIASLKIDGQKTIWLEQFRHFSKEEYEFRFISYTANQNNDGKLLGILDDLDVPSRLVDGLSISIELADVPDFPLNLVRLIRANTDMKRWYTDLRPVEVTFLQDFFERFVVPLFGLDIVTFANARTEIDTLIIEAARLAGAKRIVMELPNLYPPQHVHVDALVAPSYFVRNHPSVISDPTPCFVINPGIHIESFTKQRHECASIGAVGAEATTCSVEQQRPFRVAFVGRLAPEKSPGLFLRMAALLTTRLKKNNALRTSAGKRAIEFVIVGDGEIRGDLEPFAAYLFRHYGAESGVSVLDELEGGDPIVKFKGWVLRDSLPELMTSFDVIVNPSLRESETFCIANLEAMAAGVALVTFANAGQSEYMRNETYGLVVGPQPTAGGLANAVQWLLSHPMERLSMAQRAQTLVKEDYTMPGYLEKYRRFYSWIMTSELNNTVLGS